MSLKRAERLLPVVQMAEREEQDAARALARSQEQLRQGEVKLGELQRYRHDYQQQWLQQGSQGVSGQWLMNYQRFLSQLEVAIGQQQRSIDWLRDNQQRARDLWQQKHVRLEGLRKLVQRYRDEARQAEDRREQSLLDELAQRLNQRDTP